jgi:ring-1,2-phenylacetyl-CoA epoxidase subunit PaaD
VVTVDQIWAALEEIPDPEIPVISLVELGVIRDVAVDGDRVHIDFTPTFLGCPALEVMKRALEDKVTELGGDPDVAVIQDDSQSKAFRCPYCGSTETKLENIFGPTPCRSIRWCESCRQPFEQFKTI